jgi:hypothetical protein
VVCYHDELVDLFWIAIEDSEKACGAVREQGIAQAEVNDAAVRLTLAKHEFTEVAVICDQDAAVGAGNLENLLIGKTGSMNLGDKRSVVAQGIEIGCQSRAGALIEEKSHRGNRTSRLCQPRLAPV